MTQTHSRRLSIGGTVLFALVAQAQVALAQQPVISAVNGSLTQGALVTIVGTNLNAERTQNWDGFYSSHPAAWSFEGSAPQNDGYSLIGVNGVAYDPSVKLLGNQSAKFHLQGASPNCPTQIISDYDAFTLAGATNDIWIRTYVRWRMNTPEWPSLHIKMFNTLGQGFYLQPAGGGPNPPTSFVGTFDGIGAYGNIPSGQLQNNRWYLVEAHIKNSAPTDFTAWIDGTQIFHRTDAKTGGSLSGILFGMINVCGTTSSFDLDHWFDGFVVGSSRIYGSAIVEVGNSPNYSSANKKVQALESIADDQISFRLDTSGLGVGPHYVWVRNNTQSQSPAFFLTGGQVSGPTAPSNLRIIP